MVALALASSSISTASAGLVQISTPGQVVSFGGGSSITDDLGIGGSALLSTSASQTLLGSDFSFAGGVTRLGVALRAGVIGGRAPEPAPMTAMFNTPGAGAFQAFTGGSYANHQLRAARDAGTDQVLIGPGLLPFGNQTLTGSLQGSADLSFLGSDVGGAATQPFAISFTVQFLTSGVRRLSVDKVLFDDAGGALPAGTLAGANAPDFTPVPEPSAVGLFALALGASGVLRRRRVARDSE